MPADRNVEIAMDGPGADRLQLIATAKSRGSMIDTTLFYRIAHLPPSLQALTLPAGVHSTLAPDVN